MLKRGTKAVYVCVCVCVCVCVGAALHHDATILGIFLFDVPRVSGRNGAPLAPAAVVRACSIAVDEERREGAAAGKDKLALVRLGGGRDVAVVLAAVDAAVVADEVGRWATSGEGRIEERAVQGQVKHKA